MSIWHLQENRFRSRKFKIVDISVEEPDIEALIKTVYEDNLTLERKLAKPIPSDTGKLT